MEQRPVTAAAGRNRLEPMAQPLRIGIDAHVLGKGIGGVERVVDQIARRVPALMPDVSFFIFLNRKFVPAFPKLANCTWVPLAFSDPLLQRTLLLPYFVRRLRLDLLHVQRIIPPAAGCATIAHVHDVLPLSHPRETRGFRSAIIRRTLPSTIRGAAHILTVSASAGQAIARLFPEVTEKIAIVPNGLDHSLFLPGTKGGEAPVILTRLGLGGEPYAFYLGAIKPHKNVEVLLEAFRIFAGKNAGGKLVIAGMLKGDAHAGRLRSMIERAGLQSRVCFTGFVLDRECVELLQHARLLLAPSLGEGFDLPPVEAMACGVPVVASDIDVHREVLGDACELFDPPSPSALAAAMERVWHQEELRVRLIAGGYLCAARFSWDRAARAVADLYRKIGARLRPHLPSSTEGREQTQEGQ
jgi:alpha-1,3-rhamnosyl/mannosyltransferase